MGFAPPCQMGAYSEFQWLEVFSIILPSIGEIFHKGLQSLNIRAGCAVHNERMSND